jgi:hypothetical protein
MSGAKRCRASPKPRSFALGFVVATADLRVRCFYLENEQATGRAAPLTLLLWQGGNLLLSLPSTRWRSNDE